MHVTVCRLRVVPLSDTGSRRCMPHAEVPFYLTTGTTCSYSYRLIFRATAGALGQACSSATLARVQRAVLPTVRIGNYVEIK